MGKVVRQSGLTAAQETAEEEAKDLEAPATAELPEERERRFRTPGFAKLRTEWRKEERDVIDRVKALGHHWLTNTFADAYAVGDELWDLVRTPDRDPDTGVPRTDNFGQIIWLRKPNGGYEEDFNRLSTKEKERFLFAITTRIFDWEQRALDAWLDAMMAKAQWEERFAIVFDEYPEEGTVDDKRAFANRDAIEERYRALYWTYCHRKAEALVRSMTLLAQRIKDSMVI